MNYTLTQKPLSLDSDCLVLGIYSDVELPEFVEVLDREHQGLIKKLCQKATEPGDLIWQTDMRGFSLLIVQCGKEAEFTPVALQKRIGDITNALIKQRITSATLCLPQLPELTPNWQLEHMILHMDNVCYQFLEFKKNHPRPHALEAVAFYLPKADERILDVAKAVSTGVHLARNLADMPANRCTPTYLGEQAQQLAQEYSTVTCTLMGLDDIKKMGMGAFLAVAQGSDEPPRFIDIQYRAGGSQAPIVLVGKGITFDSGGLSIKPANAMDEMKYDMSGAASVLGTIKACALLKLPVNVIGLIASAENMLNGTAIKPGDVVTSMSGQTIEILNTDAEGRLVLADALTYAERYDPDFVIDIATLTGAIIVALGSVSSGFMTEDTALASLIEAAAAESNDRVWRMPLDDAYQDALDSPIADMINAHFDRSASSITAACFLSRFTKTYRWAHLDIAGTAWVSGKKRHATGRPVPLLTQIIRHAANNAR